MQAQEGLICGAATGAWRRTGRIRQCWTRRRAAWRAMPGRPATAAGRPAGSRPPGPSPSPRRPLSVAGGPCAPRRSCLCSDAGHAKAALGCLGCLRFSCSQMRRLDFQRRLCVKCLGSVCRSGSAVKRSQDLAFGSPLGSQPKRREMPLKGAVRERQRSGSGSGAKPGTSTARRRKRRALLDILEKASPPDPHCIGSPATVQPSMRWPEMAVPAPGSVRLGPKSRPRAWSLGLMHKVAVTPG